MGFNQTSINKIVNSRYLQHPQKQSRGNQLFHRQTDRQDLWKAVFPF